MAPPGSPAAPCSLTQQQEAEHPLQHGQELERGTDVALRGPGHGQQRPQGSLDAGPAACGEGDATLAQNSTARTREGPPGCRGGEVGWEG